MRPGARRQVGALGAGAAVLILVLLGSIVAIYWLVEPLAEKAGSPANGSESAADDAERRDRAGNPVGRGAKGRTGRGARSRAAPSVPALPSPLSMLEPAAAGSWTPRPESGWMLTLESTLDPEPGAEPVVDARVAEQAALHVGRGERVSPFVRRGPFRATWTGALQVPIRDRYQFRVAGRGAVKITVGDSVLIDETLQAGAPWIESKARRLRKGDNPMTVAFIGNGLGESTLRVWWKSTESPWEPIHAAQVTHDAAHPRLVRAQAVRRGRVLFAEMRCVRCHASDRQDAGWLERGMWEARHGGPSLVGVGARMKPGWLRQWIADPRAQRADTRMPDLQLDQEQVASVVAFLGTLDEAPVGRGIGVTDLVAQGLELFERTGCLACHTHRRAATADLELARRIGLDHVAAKWREQPLAEFLADPRRHDPGSRMPDFGLDDDEASALAAFLCDGGEDDQAWPHDGDVDAGRAIAARACAACHDLGDAVVPDSAEAPPPMESLLGKGGGCLAEDPKAAGAPTDYGLTTSQREDLMAFLGGGQPSLAHQVPVEYAGRVIESLRCTQCHTYGSGAAAWNAIHDALPLDHEQLEEGGALQSPPLLTWVGGKLHGAWLQRFLKGEIAERPRPWLRVRMPAFPERGQDMARGLVAAQGYPGVSSAADDPIDSLLANHGQKLAGNQGGFNCITCHAVGDQPATQVFETQGINFDRVYERLRPDYFERWMADPPRINADARMPKYAQPNGKTALVEVLEGDASRQFGAVWHYLHQLGR